MNNVLIDDTHDFVITDGSNNWLYTDLVDIGLTSGSNKIKLLMTDQTGGPNIDHLRVGKPPA